MDQSVEDAVVRLLVQLIRATGVALLASDAPEQWKLRSELTEGLAAVRAAQAAEARGTGR